MDRPDDPSLVGNIPCYRRIPPGRVEWHAGVPEIRSDNFRDKELSIYIASETNPEEVLDGHPGYGLSIINISDIRTVYANYPQLKIVRDLIEPEKGHILVLGKSSPGVGQKLRDKANWVDGYWPEQIPEPPGSEGSDT